MLAAEVKEAGAKPAGRAAGRAAVNTTGIFWALVHACVLMSVWELRLCCKTCKVAQYAVVCVGCNAGGVDAGQHRDMCS
jgi:hypothetical protein